MSNGLPHPSRRTILLSLLLAPALPAIPVGAQEADTILDEVWRTARDNFWNPGMNGVDWPSLRAAYAPRYRDAADPAEKRRLINEMLGALHASHTEYFIADEPAYYELVDLFSFAYRGRLRNFFDQGRVSYVGIGAYTTEIDGKRFVSGVLDGLPADRAGLKIGDEILSADGAPFQEIASFAGKQGHDVTLALRRRADGPIENLDIRPTEIRPARSLLDALESSARIIERGGKKIGYIHMWCYFGDNFQRALERQLATTLKDADALVWDLRDGWGGTADGDLDIFNRREPTLEATSRDGRVSYSNVKWTKPAVALINGGTRSAKEIVAYGFKKYGIGAVVGSPTAKAVLGSRGYLMQDGSFLLLAVSDIKIDGERLEGVGVTPTVPVDSPLPYRDGADPQLDRALDIASGG